MPAPLRPSLNDLPDSSTSSVIVQTRLHALHPLLTELEFYIVPSKLGEATERLYACIRELGGRTVPTPGTADMALTALRGRARLEKVLAPGVLGSVPIVHVDFIKDTFEECLQAAANSTTPRLPDRKQYTVVPRRPRPTTPHNKRRHSEPADDLEPLQEDISLSEISKWAVLRPSPLICVNQDIIDAIKPIFLEREFEAGEQKSSNILSYRRSMSILKAVPRRIKSGEEAMQLVDVGAKVADRIDEYLSQGFIADSLAVNESERYKTLVELASVFTIGHATALELYDTHGCRSVRDVVLHYASLEDGVSETERARRRREGGMSKGDIVSEWVKIRDELATPIPRDEVEEIGRCVYEQLEAVAPGCDYTLCGGYRRGKTQSNDVDVVFAPPDKGLDKGLLQKIYRRLSAFGIVTHVLQLTRHDSSEHYRHSSNNFDNLDKAFVILKLPGPGRLHRRVDLISAPRARYEAAVLSWSGSMMFERDLRRYAQDVKGYKFAGGLIDLRTGEEINLPTEREIFAFLGLRYVPPTLRNADG